jgi:hypothetical protein
MDLQTLNYLCNTYEEAFYCNQLQTLIKNSIKNKLKSTTITTITTTITTTIKTMSPVNNGINWSPIL